MKKATVQDLQRHTEKLVTQAQKDRVIITRQGKPAAVLVGVTEQDWESVIFQTDPSSGDSSTPTGNKRHVS
jgi:prevent-host-death family protein